MARLQELAERPTALTGGHRLCPGCGEPIVVRQVLMSTDDPVIAASCTGCLEVSTTIFPYTAWDIPWIHIAFENAAATIAGIEAMYKALKTKAGYIGMIGSKKKRKTIYAALRESGYSNQDLERVHCPIGLDIGALTPAEIAVSIVAEMITVRAGNLKRLGISTT